MTVHVIGPVAKARLTLTIKPSDAWAFDAADDLPTDAAIPRATSMTTLKMVPQM